MTMPARIDPRPVTPAIVCSYGTCTHPAGYVGFLTDTSPPGGKCSGGCLGHPFCACCLLIRGHGVSRARKVTVDDVTKVAAEQTTKVPADFRLVTS